MEEHSGHGGIDAAAQSEDDASIADLRAGLRHRIPDEGFHRPGFFAATDADKEVFQHPFPLRGVSNLRVELKSVESPFRVLNSRVFRIRSGRRGFKTGGQPADGISVTHPAPGIGFNSKENTGCIMDRQFGKAIFSLVGSNDLPAQGIDHVLHTVTDAQDRNVQVKDRAVYPRAARIIDTRRPTGQDNAFRAKGFDHVEVYSGGFDLTVNVLFPDTPGNQLIVL
jgi:hypothetical protein